MKEEEAQESQYQVVPVHCPYQPRLQVIGALTSVPMEPGVEDQVGSPYFMAYIWCILR